MLSFILVPSGLLQPRGTTRPFLWLPLPNLAATVVITPRPTNGHVQMLRHTGSQPVRVKVWLQNEPMLHDRSTFQCAANDQHPSTSQRLTACSILHHLL